MHALFQVPYLLGILVVVELSVLWFPHEFYVFRKTTSVLFEYCAEHFERKTSLCQLSWRQLPWHRVEICQYCFLGA